MKTRKKRTSDYVCCDCGEKFLKETQSEIIATFHYSNCGVCGKYKPVTHVRHWNWLKKKTNESKDNK